MSGSKSSRPTPSEEMKRKFREALDKKAAHGGADVSDATDHGKVEHGHAAETSAREQMFRRKSG